MRKQCIILHADGTITCWRVATGDVRRTPHSEVSADDVRVMRTFDRERFAGAYPMIRTLVPDRTLCRVRMNFVLVLPLGESLPSPTLEAIEAAALAIAGPVRIAPRSRISVRRTRISRTAGLAMTDGMPQVSSPPADRRARGAMVRSLDQDDVHLMCSRGHPSLAARPSGYMALKEAGADLTILAYECPVCYRRLYVTAEVPVARVATVDFAAHDDVE